MMVAARDNPPPDLGNRVQVRAFAFLGRDKGWEFRKDAIDGPFSTCLMAWDFDGDGHEDVLLGNHWAGQLRLLWRNNGDGTFSFVRMPVIEPLVVSHGGRTGIPRKGQGQGVRRFLHDASSASRETPRVGDLDLCFEDGAWTRHRVWRKKDAKASVTGLAMGDLDGDGLDDLVFADSEQRRVRILLQQPDGSFSGNLGGRRAAVEFARAMRPPGRHQRRRKARPGRFEDRDCCESERQRRMERVPEQDQLICVQSLPKFSWVLWREA